MTADTIQPNPNKRETNFVKAWEAKYPGKTSLLIQGNTSFRTTVLDKHWNLKPHERAAKSFNEVGAHKQAHPYK